MAAFSNQNHPFHTDHIFPPNTTFIIKASGFSQEPNTISCFSQFYPPESHNKNSTDSSVSVVDRKAESGEQVTQKMIISMDKKRSYSDGSSLSSVQMEEEAREAKGKKQKRGGDGVRKEDKEKKGKSGKNDQKIKVAKEEEGEGEGEAPTIGYVHVRARRGQATDSHSLAERVRREKISERMKQLQGLVPGCDKMTGKALILDEIINYVQSLQNQVEFLSMKLGSVNSMFYDFGMDLDALLATPEILDCMASPLASGPQCSQAQPTAFSDTNTNTNTNTFTTPDNYPLLDSISSLLFDDDDRQVQMPIMLQPQDNGQLWWEVDEQRQKIINQNGFHEQQLVFFPLI